MITKRRLLDIALLIALCLYSFSATIDHIGDQRAQGQQPFFYQSYFEPAVLVACGHEFGTLPDGKRSESLVSFLNLKSLKFDCRDLPSQPEILKPKHLGQWMYMMQAVATTWKIFGVDWIAVDKLAGLFVAVSFAALYGIFRTFVPIPIATLGIILIIMSHRFFDISPFFRDLSKAPFILLSLLSIISIATHTRWRLKTLILASIIGLLAGVGVGFRPDAIIVLPLTAFVIFVFPKGWGVKDLTNKTLSCVLMGVIFWQLSAPIRMDAESSGTCKYHWALLGFGKTFSGPLSVEHGSFGLIYEFSDSLVHSVVESHAKRVLGQSSTSYCGPDYDIASGDLFQRLVITLPAEFYTRALASVRQISFLPELPREIGDLTPATLMFILMYVFFLRKPREAFCLGICLLFLLGYPATQFHIRHYFHITFIPLLMMLIVFNETFNFGRAQFVKAHGLKGMLFDITAQIREWSEMPKFRHRSVMFVLVMLLPLIITMFALRYYQTTKLEELVQKYEDYNWSSLDLTSGPLSSKLPIGGSLMRITVDKTKCQATNSEIELVYDDTNPSLAFNRNISALSEEGTQIDGVYYAQIFNDTIKAKMTHISISDGFHDCILDVSVANPSGKNDLWLDMQTKDGHVARPYSTFK